MTKENLPPFQIVFLRFSAAALVLLPVLLFQGRSPELRDAKPLSQAEQDADAKRWQCQGVIMCPH
jgi:drug/metabolite transporter (DMT)-like permease